MSDPGGAASSSTSAAPATPSSTMGDEEFMEKVDEWETLALSGSDGADTLWGALEVAAPGAVWRRGFLDKARNGVEAEQRAETERQAKEAERQAKEAAEQRAETERQAKEAERQAKEDMQVTAKMYSVLSRSHGSFTRRYEHIADNASSSVSSKRSNEQQSAPGQPDGHEKIIHTVHEWNCTTLPSADDKDVCDLVRAISSKSAEMKQVAEAKKVADVDKAVAKKLETGHVQPFVNKVLAAGRDVWVRKIASGGNRGGRSDAESVQAQYEGAACYLSMYCASADELAKDIDDQLFRFTGVRSVLHRVPDAALYIDLREKDNRTFDKYAARTALLTVEVKTDIKKTALFNEAVREVVRDFANMAGGVPRAQMRVGHAVITDGWCWQVLRMHWTFQLDTATAEWRVQIRASPKIEVDYDQTVGWPTLARWLWAAWCAATDGEVESTGLGKCGAGGWTCDAALSSSRLITARLVREDDPQCFAVVKVPATRSEETDAMIAQEVGVLQQLSELDGHADSCIVAPYSDELTRHIRAVWMCDGTRSIDEWDTRGERGRILAKLVYNDIYVKALGFLHRHDWAHCDVWPKNILVPGELERALLCDVESCRKIGESLEKVPTLAPKYDGDVASVERDQICTEAVLYCLWKDDKSFDDFKAEAEKRLAAFNKDGKRNDTVLACMTSRKNATRASSQSN